MRIFIALMAVCAIAYAQPGPPPTPCTTLADIYIVATCSDTMVELPQLMMGLRDGLAGWFARTDANARNGPQVSVCCYGTTAQEQISPGDPLEPRRITMVGGISHLDLGIECARLSSQANGRPGVPQYMVLIVSEDPLGFGGDDFTQDARIQVERARAEGFSRISLTAVTDNVYPEFLRDFGDQDYFVEIPTDFTAFAARSEPGEGEPVDAALWRQYCPELPTTTTTTTTPTPQVGCNDCIIIEGIGYNYFEGDCRRFLQCFFDGSVPPFAIKWTAMGTFWDMPQVEQHWPKDTVCPWDPCTINGQVMQFWPDERNCAGYWMCGMIDGTWRTAEWKCCALDEYWDDAASQCVIDTNEICDATCLALPPDPIENVHLGSGIYLFLGNYHRNDCFGYRASHSGDGSSEIIFSWSADGHCQRQLQKLFVVRLRVDCPMVALDDPRFYRDSRDPDAEEWACKLGMIFSMETCTCEGSPPVDEFCTPIFNLTFDGGLIKDLSRNEFWIADRGAIFASLDQATGRWYGEFDGSSQLFVPGLSNLDLLRNWAFVVNYNPMNNNNRRGALIGSTNCAKKQGSYYLSLMTGDGNLEGYVKTQSGRSDFSGTATLNNVATNAINRAVYMYRNGTLSLKVGTNEDSVEIFGRMWRRDSLCGFHIGWSQEMNYFSGRIYDVLVYRDPDCIPDNL